MGVKGRILFISPQPFFEWRGSPIRVRFDVCALAELGYDVDLLTLPIGQDVEVPGVRVHRVPNLYGFRSIPIGPSWKKALFDLVLLIVGLRMAFRGRYTHIHGVEDAGVIAWIISRLAGAKFVFEKHSDPMSYRKKRGLQNLIMSVYTVIERFTVRRADALIGTGRGLCEQMRKMDSPVLPHHVFDIPSSCVEATPEKVDAIRAGLCRLPGEVVVMYVGSFALYQGIDLMFDSMPLTLSTCPQVRFVIIGGTPEQVVQRRAWLQGAGLADKVDFVARVDPGDLPDYLSAADILLSPRLSGVNTPLKILDYLKAGRPIVATRSDSNLHILDDVTAVIVDMTPEAFARGICRLVHDAGLRAEIGRRGQEKARSRYSFAEFKRRLQQCYDGLVACIVAGILCGVWAGAALSCATVISNANPC